MVPSVSMLILFGIACTFLDKDKVWTILAWTLVLHADPDPLPVAGWRDHVLEARALGLHAVARAPRTQVVAQRLALARHAHLVACQKDTKALYI
jgi:hypothetical protein